MKCVSIGLAAVLAMGLATATSASPITTPPPTLTASGDVTAFYVFASAQNTSVLNLTSPLPGMSSIFCNHDTSGCTAATPGDSVFLGNLSASLVFSLDNLSTGSTFFSDTADADGNYHVLITNNLADFGGSLSLPTSLADFITANPGIDVTFVGWEDRNLAQGSDFDYNDLIFAFTNTSAGPITTPEPATLALLGAGLMALGAGLHRKKS